MTEDQEYELLVGEERHKAMLKILKEILEKPMPKLNIEEIRQAIDNQSRILENFVSLLSKQDHTVNVETNQDQVVDSLQGMAEQLTTSIQDVKKALDGPKQPTEWVFMVDRDEDGLISKVRVKSR